MPLECSEAVRGSIDPANAEKPLLRDPANGIQPGNGMPDALRDDIRAHAAESHPKECCGFVITDGKRQRAVRSPNLSDEPGQNFRTCPKVWRDIEDSGWEVIAIYHSHPNQPPIPSPADKTEAEKKHLPFIIVGWPTDSWDIYMPCGWRAELYGRPFVHGILDCYAFCRDWYEIEKGIVLPDFDREDDWWNKGQNLYMDNFAKAGFSIVPELKAFDSLLIQMPRSPVVNHAAVYLGDGMIGHHISGRISRREPYVAGFGNYSRGVRAIVRHESLL